MYFRKTLAGGDRQRKVEAARYLLTEEFST